MGNGLVRFPAALRSFVRDLRHAGRRSAAGVRYGWVRRFVSAPVAIAVVAAVFALCHLQYGVETITIFAVGCVLGWIRERSGTLRAPIAVHAGYNGILLGLKIVATALG